MNAMKPREISLGDLAALTIRANVVFAVRCAQRLRPCLELPLDSPRREVHQAAIDAAIDVAADFCRAPASVSGGVGAAIAAAITSAEETCTMTRFAGYAAVRAAEAAEHAEAYLQNPSDANLIDVVAGAFGAARVLVSNADRQTQDMVVSALLADIDLLAKFTASNSQDIGPPIDPSETGPLGSLWPTGMPGWIEEMQSVNPTIIVNTGRAISG